MNNKRVYADRGDSMAPMGQYNGYKRFNTKESGMPSIEFDALKYKYGAMVAKLIAHNLGIWKIRTLLTEEDSVMIKVIKDLETYHTAIIEARPSAADFISEAYYTGLKFQQIANKEGVYIPSIKFLGGSQSAGTLIIKSSNDLNKYCEEIHSLLEDKHMAEKFGNFEYLDDLDQQLNTISYLRPQPSMTIEQVLP